MKFTDQSKEITRHIAEDGKKQFADEFVNLLRENGILDTMSLWYEAKAKKIEESKERLWASSVDSVQEKLVTDTVRKAQRQKELLETEYGLTAEQIISRAYMYDEMKQKIDAHETLETQCASLKTELMHVRKSLTDVNLQNEELKKQNETLEEVKEKWEACVTAFETIKTPKKK